MLEQLGQSVRRMTGGRKQEPLVRLGDSPIDAVDAAQTDIATLRGVTAASADIADCTCPDPCERDHANE
jgi:hypothetical protein